jgi:TPP-dependent pyruvate/acetoin dehydrogenase alpha subunit
MVANYTVEELIEFSKLVKSMWEAKQIKCPVHLCGGQEEQIIEVFKDIRPQDYVFASHRNYYAYLLKGGDKTKLLDEMMRLSSGVCGGRSGSMNTTDRAINFFSSAIVGGVCGPAVGVGWAIRQKKVRNLIMPIHDDILYEEGPDDRHVYCFLGDGGLDGGHFWSALQYAEGWDLPVTFVIEDNDRSTDSSIKERFGRTLLELGLRTNLYVRGVWGNKYIKYYGYEPIYPHCGSGVYIQF